MLRCLLWAFPAAVQPKALLIADNLCLRQQLLVLQRRMPRPHLEDVDRRFWILACRWFSGWRTSLLIVKPETASELAETVGDHLVNVHVELGSAASHPHMK